MSEQATPAPDDDRLVMHVVVTEHDRPFIECAIRASSSRTYIDFEQSLYSWDRRERSATTPAPVPAVTLSLEERLERALVVIGDLLFVIRSDHAAVPDHWAHRYEAASTKLIEHGARRFPGESIHSNFVAALGAEAPKP